MVTISNSARPAVGRSPLRCYPAYFLLEVWMLLKDKVAVITGGGRGIGRAIALRFANEGAAVVIAARTQSEIVGVALEIREAGGRAAAVPADVADEMQCQQLMREATGQFGKVDILVNNAGEYGPVKPIEEISSAEWD